MRGPWECVRKAGLLYAWGLVAACQSEAIPDDPLRAVLAREQSKALAAARIGPEGGSLELSGDYEGAALIIPAGVLGGDAVFSAYPAEPAINEEDGYTPVGPFVRFEGTVRQFRRDAIVRMPYATENTAAPVVLLARDPDLNIRPVAGVFVGDTYIKGPVRELADFGVAADAAGISLDDDEVPRRCPLMNGAVTLQSAIRGTRLYVNLAWSDAAPFTARSYDANACGVAKRWEVAWFSALDDVYSLYSYTVTGAVPVVEQAALSCAPTAYLGSVDSPAVADDVFARTGVTGGLVFEVRNCNVGQSPPRLRVGLAGTGEWLEYDAAGGFIGQNF